MVSLIIIPTSTTNESSLLWTNAVTYESKPNTLIRPWLYEPNPQWNANVSITELIWPRNL